MKSRNLLIDIFITFFRIGLFTFGGGFAMIPLIEKEVVDNKKWAGKEDITDILAVSQSIPGAVAINSASFIGFKIYGRKGALAATLGVILPSFIIISVIAAFFGKIDENTFVKAAFMGIRPAIVALIIAAAIKVGKTSIKDFTGLIIALAALILSSFFNIQIILLIMTGGLFGVVLMKIDPARAEKIVRRSNNGRKAGSGT